MGQLALIWDGTWLTWTAEDSADVISRREISSPSMVKEVLKALRKQLDSGTSVIHVSGASGHDNSFGAVVFSVGERRRDQAARDPSWSSQDVV